MLKKAGAVKRLCGAVMLMRGSVVQRLCHAVVLTARAALDNDARLMSSDVADLDYTTHRLALTVIPRVRITTRLAYDTKTGGLHATASAIRADIAVASVALEHSLKGVGGCGLHGIDLIDIALESLAVLQGHQRVGARVFVDGLGVGLDRAAGSSTQLAISLVSVVAVELLGVPLEDVVRVTAVADRAAQLQRR
jgi:hypothetical protein